MKYPIVVGTDLTEASDDAVIQAEARATRDSVALTVVHATPSSLWPTGNGSYERERALQLIFEQVTALTGRVETEFDVVIQRGAPHTVLTQVAASRGALLIVGSQMEHGLGHALVRNVSERVLARARGPVLVTRPGRATGRILVAVDRPFNSAAVLDVAAEEARAADSKLIVLHCVPSGLIETLARDVINGGVYAARPLGQFSSQLADARRTLSAELKHRGIEHELHVLEGRPARVIREVALELDADLMVIGTARYPAQTPHTTAELMRRVGCSVLVVDDGRANANANANAIALQSARAAREHH
jgi:nucleotide-binding universal stress UspA family protein